MRQINAIIQLRRGNDYNFDKIKDSFIPANGEAVLVDTSSTGLRIKIGDGITNYGNLPYADEDARQSVLMGYYFDGVFYQDIDKTTLLRTDSNKLYIARNQGAAYYFDGVNFVNLQEYASSNKAGIVKLYNELGDNTDGPITQKKITQELNARYKTSVNAEEELLVFSL